MQMQQPNEVWKDIQSYEGFYQVSSLGRIRSLNRTVRNRLGFTIAKGKVLSGVSKNGYLRVQLFKEGRWKSYPIHRLVANAFLSNSNSMPEVNHKNEDKGDNRVDNLEWCDRKQNCNYGTRTKRQSEKLSKKVLQLTIDGKLVSSFKSTAEVFRVLGFRSSHISECCNGIRTISYGYKWRYSNE